MKERVCTVTYHNVGMNYGQTLQAFALQKVLEKMGYYTILLNYYTPLGHYKFNKLFFLNRYADAGINNFIKQVKFDCFIRKNISLTKLCRNTEQVRNVLDELKITHLVCGSDQIWNPSGMDAVYFLEFGDKNASRVKIAYAASMCSKEVMKQFENKHMVLKHLIEKVDYISMREQSGVEIVKELTGRNAENVLDPTLLLNKKYWRTIAKKRITSKKYMVCFFYGDMKQYIGKIKEIAKKMDINYIINIQTSPECMEIPGWKNIKNAGPRDFISYLSNASAVCTDSFHGTAFSINLNRELFSFVRLEDKTSGNNAVSNGTRISNMMEKLGIKNRWISKESKINEIEAIDYDSVNRKLRMERKRSLAFLRGALEGRNDISDN